MIGKTFSHYRIVEKIVGGCCQLRRDVQSRLPVITTSSSASGARCESWHVKKHIADRPLKLLLGVNLSS
jgi:hypothetical protein